MDQGLLSCPIGTSLGQSRLCLTEWVLLLATAPASHASAGPHVAAGIADCMLDGTPLGTAVAAAGDADAARFAAVWMDGACLVHVPKSMCRQPVAAGAWQWCKHILRHACTWQMPSTCDMRAPGRCQVPAILVAVMRLGLGSHKVGLQHCSTAAAHMPDDTTEAQQVPQPKTHSSSGKLHNTWAHACCAQPAEMVTLVMRICASEVCTAGTSIHSVACLARLDWWYATLCAVTVARCVCACAGWTTPACAQCTSHSDTA
jgi:hypothetical protein